MKGRQALGAATGACWFTLTLVFLLGGCSSTPGGAGGPLAARGAADGSIGLPSSSRSGSAGDRNPEFADFSDAVELGETYGELLDEWEELYEQVFATVSQPRLGRAPAADAELQLRLASYRAGLRELIPTPITDQVVQSEERSLASLMAVFKLVAAFGDAPTQVQLSSPVRLMLEAGTAHEEARAIVGRYLESFGLDFGI